MKKEIQRDTNGENVLQLEITEVTLVHCNLVSNTCKHDLRAFRRFISNKLFGKLLEILQTKFIFSKTFSSEFSYVEVWYTEHNSQTLEIKIE